MDEGVEDGLGVGLLDALEEVADAVFDLLLLEVEAVLFVDEVVDVVCALAEDDGVLDKSGGTE